MEFINNYRSLDGCPEWLFPEAQMAGFCTLVTAAVGTILGAFVLSSPARGAWMYS